jgi:hypothetical protein
MKWFILLLLPFQVHAQNCPSDDSEAAVTVKTKAGPTVFVCGFEDREVPRQKGKRAFSDFDVYFKSEKNPTATKIFTAEEDETYWVSAQAEKGVQLEELWFFNDKPQSALHREITCTAETCTLSAEKCVFKMKSNPFPKALAQFQSKAKEGKLQDNGEELLDQIFAQAIKGDKAAKDFYASKPSGLDKALTEVFETNHKKLKQGCK